MCNLSIAGFLKLVQNGFRVSFTTKAVRNVPYIPIFNNELFFVQNDFPLNGKMRFKNRNVSHTVR